MTIAACPFCGEVPVVSTVDHWTGMRYVPIRWEIDHHCERGLGNARVHVKVSSPAEWNTLHKWNERT